MMFMKLDICIYVIDLGNNGLRLISLYAYPIKLASLMVLCVCTLNLILIHLSLYKLFSGQTN